jgi:N-acylglucosamine 2-epimerase
MMPSVAVDDSRFVTLPEDPADWGRFYRQHLLEFVMPFWLRYAVDETHGGLLTCLEDDGRVVSTDKYLWSQTRALWTFSALYRRIEPRNEWIEVAHRLFAFCRRHGHDADYCWHFRTDREGRVREGPISIVTDCFAILGLVEYARVTGSTDATELARRTFESVRRRFASGRPFGTAPYPLPAGMRAHRYAMQCSLAYHELGCLLGSEEVLAAAWGETRAIMDVFVRPEHRALVEYVNSDGSFSDTPAGRTLVPGHGIESMWFQLEIFRVRGETGEVRRAAEVMEWCLERGWDEVHGGLFLGLDIMGREPVFWKHATAKLWWAAAEGLGATLVAWAADPRPEWGWHHARLARWALERFPVRAHGEWRQRLDRAGNPLAEVVALPVKDPFHLPRGLIVAIEAHARLVARGLLSGPTAEATALPS